MNQYSWATPDTRALNILKHFGSQCNGVVEIGCGANAYWARQIHDLGIDVMAFDSHLKKGGKIDYQDDEEEAQESLAHERKKRKTDDNHSSRGVKKTFGDGLIIHQGGPEVLSSDDSKYKDLDKRVLFLCYPDEDVLDEVLNQMTNEKENDGEESEKDANFDAALPTSLGAACLEHFRGEIVIHVGELVGDTLSLDQAPWGRSTGPECQQRLCAEYHCLLKAKLTNWLHVRDTISVWKRSKVCSIVFQGEDDDDTEEVEYKYIPEDEKLPSDVAASCVKHLL